MSLPSTVVDWASLVQQNRAKAPGIPWSEAELKAMQDGVSADDIRAGFLDKEAVAQADASGEKKLERMNKPELAEIAKGLGLDFDYDAVTKADLVIEIQNAQEALSDKT